MAANTMGHVTLCLSPVTVSVMLIPELSMGTRSFIVVST